MHWGIFRYGFEVTPTEVCKEWLYKKACKPRSNEIELFYRENGQFNVHAKYSQAQELVNKKMIRDNAPFERDYLLGKFGATPIIGNPNYALQSQGYEQH